MSSETQRLREKLGRELAQSEHDAVIHCEREAGRLGDVRPAIALRMISAHAKQLRPRLDEVLVVKQPVGLRLARTVAETFSGLRHFLFDRMLSAERSYRATLLGLGHGLDTARLLCEVAKRDDDSILLFQFCNQLIADREPLLREAEGALAWFAEHPALANA
jgi:hypothetical protein